MQECLRSLPEERTYRNMENGLILSFKYAWTCTNGQVPSLGVTTVLPPEERAFSQRVGRRSRHHAILRQIFPARFQGNLIYSANSSRSDPSSSESCAKDSIGVLGSCTTASRIFP